MKERDNMMFGMQGQSQAERSQRIVKVLGRDRDEEYSRGGLLISGDEYYVRFVKDGDEFQKFWWRLDAIKENIAATNREMHSGQLSDKEYRQKLEDVWLNVCVRSFVLSYGVESVPFDVRVAIDDVIMSLDTKVVEDIIGEWPQMKDSGLNVGGNPDWLHFTINEF
eukprot:scaffold6464_cov145-Skeletonema_menzelii.AAC.21